MEGNNRPTPNYSRWASSVVGFQVAVHECAHAGREEGDSGERRVPDTANVREVGNRVHQGENGSIRKIFVQVCFGHIKSE